MRKIIFAILMVMLVAMLPAAITYSTVTSKTLNNFASYTANTTVVVADTTAPYILSSTFTYGDKMSNRGMLIQGVVNTSLQHTVNTAVGKLKAVLQVSADGTNFADFASYDAYMSSAATAGTILVIPLSLSGVYAPYYRVKWVGYSAAGVALVADIFGKITTTITVPGTP